LAEGVQETWRQEIGVVEHVEELRPELDIEGFGDLVDWEVLKYGEVDRGEARPIEFVAAGIAEYVWSSIAVQLARRRAHSCKTAGRSQTGSRSGKRKRSRAVGGVKQAVFR